MNCSEFERSIAAEVENPELTGHLALCASCREFAAEVEANRVALRETAVHPAALEAVRRRVLDEIQASRRRKFVWWPVAVAMAAAILVVAYLLPRTPVGTVAPRVVAKSVESSRPAVRNNVARPAAAHRSHRVHTSVNAARRSACATCGAVAVKMLTDDPDVIIIWLVDGKGD